MKKFLFLLLPVLVLCAGVSASFGSCEIKKPDKLKIEKVETLDPHSCLIVVGCPPGVVASAILDLLTVEVLDAYGSIQVSVSAENAEKMKELLQEGSISISRKAPTFDNIELLKNIELAKYEVLKEPEYIENSTPLNLIPYDKGKLNSRAVNAKNSRINRIRNNC